MKVKDSLKFKVLLSFVLTISVPLIIIAGIAPYYYYKVITDRTSVLYQSLINSVKTHYETYLDEMERLTLNPYYSTDAIYALSLHNRGGYPKASSYEKLVANRAISDLMRKYFQDTNQYITGSILVSTDGTSYVYSSYGPSNLNPDFIGTKSDWYQRAIQADGKAAYIGAHKQDYLKQSDGSTVFSVSRVIKDPVTRQKVGVVMVDARTNVLNDIIKSVGFNVNSTIAVFDEKNNTVFSSEYISDEVKSQILSKKDTVKLDNGYYKIISSSVLKCNWKMVVMFSLSDINSDLTVMYIAGFLFAVCGFVFTLFIFLIFSKRMTEPFNKMILTMNEVKKGNLAVRFKTHGNDEIAQLGQEFNNMLIRIDDLVNREYKANLAMKEAQFYALQSQIKPHFLFNTLNGFIGLNRMDDRKTLEKAILSLTRMMRYVFDCKDEVHVKDELAFLDDYCMLQRLRFEDRLDYSIQYCDEVADELIPKLILQPIVENAVIHGIEPLSKLCHLRISCGKLVKEDRVIIRFEVRDDGAGFDPDMEIKDNSKGLKNVQERLNLRNGYSHFFIQSRPGDGTAVIIEIQKEDSNENSDC